MSFIKPIVAAFVSVFFAVVATAGHFASFPSNEAIRDLGLSATRMVIIDNRPPLGRTIPPPDRIDEQSKNEIVAFIAALKLSDVPRGEKSIVDGEEVWISTSSYCQCLPDYKITFYKDDREILSFELNHWNHIRLRENNSWYDVDLIPSSTEGLKKALQRYFLSDEAFFKRDGR